MKQAASWRLRLDSRIYCAACSLWLWSIQIYEEMGLKSLERDLVSRLSVRGTWTRAVHLGTARGAAGPWELAVLEAGNGALSACQKGRQRVAARVLLKMVSIHFL